MKNGISVIVTVYNGATYLPSALKSIVKQTTPPNEILVVDGPSTDATPEIAKTNAGVLYIRLPRRGLAEARNVGIKEARGNLIAFLDSDDWWNADKLKIQVTDLFDRPDSYGNLTWVKLFLENGVVLRPGFKSAAFESGQPGFTPGALVVRRKMFDRIGYFDPSYKIGCDHDWFARVRDAGISLNVIPRVLLHKRIHAGNLSANVGSYRKEMMDILANTIKRKRGILPSSA